MIDLILLAAGPARRFGQEQLLGDEILSRKEEIVGASLHLKGGATC